MKMADKWSALFHNVLQREECVTPAIAGEAHALIGWIARKWAAVQKAEGYYDESDPLVSQTNSVLEALRARSCQETSAGSWPSAILTAWGLRNPFVSVVGTDALQSEWETLYEVMRAGLQVPAQGSSFSEAVCVIADAVPLRRAWVQVLRALLPEDHRLFQECASVADLPAIAPSIARLFLVFGSSRDAQAQAATLELWQQRHGVSLQFRVVKTTCVAEALADILEQNA